jgi:hypothetical protein
MIGGKGKMGLFPFGDAHFDPDRIHKLVEDAIEYSVKGGQLNPEYLVTLLSAMSIEYREELEDWSI